MTKKPNGLISENSPYLLQHAYNPVDWCAWNEETLDKARKSNRMLLVSIGYSSCHWCHVMERESFEDESVANIMNEHFICVKVDREERPDVDHFFMEAIHLLGGRGGWPLNCFALPDGRPVWGGTYFKREQWKSIMLQIAKLWEKQSPDLFTQADHLIQAIKEIRTTDKAKDTESITALLHHMATECKSAFDPLHGGDAGAPKFPMPDKLRFLLLMGVTNSDNDLIEHVERSLDKMASGGIYDQVGGGFARYSVDARWHVPHFEKMLYDNAQLISLYAEAYKVFKKPLYEEIVNDSLLFLTKNMMGDEGAFYCALDADSEGVEGKYYVWTLSEFDTILGEDAGLIGAYFGIGNEAVWEDELNVLVIPEEKARFCEKHHLEIKAFEKKLETARKKLLAHRSERIAPGLDDKRLLSWNALQISALATAYDVFGNKNWLIQARKTSDFILSAMRRPAAGLFRSWKNGKAKIKAFLDDYSLMINALIQLYQSDSDESYLLDAYTLSDYVIKHFYNEKESVFEYTPKGYFELVVHPREIYDNVIPSSNASMCMALVKLGMLFENQSYLSMAEKMIRCQFNMMNKYPSGFTHWGQALYLLENQAMVILRGPNANEACKTLRRCIPLYILTAASYGNSSIPVVANKRLGGSLKYWYCDHRGCQLPVEKISDLPIELHCSS